MRSFVFAIVAAGLATVSAPSPASAQALRDASFIVRLTAPLDSSTSQEGQEVTSQVVSPAQYANWFMVGRVDKVLSSGKVNKRSELRFTFQKLVNADGSKVIPVTAVVKTFTNSKGVRDADEEGQIVEKGNAGTKAGVFGGIAGGTIGAIAGGAKGAAIGAGAGAGAGLLFASFGVKGPKISFASGSQFELTVSNQGQPAQ